jgi:hypothetical protein
MWHKEVPVSMGLKMLHRKLQSVKEGKAMIMLCWYFLVRNVVLGVGNAKQGESTHLLI